MSVYDTFVNTRLYALQFEGSNSLFECYSDAAFGDNQETRKSSQGYLMKLFAENGGSDGLERIGDHIRSQKGMSGDDFKADPGTSAAR